MNKSEYFIRTINSLLSAPPSDEPDNARRRRLLNIILVGLIVASILTVLTAGIIFLIKIGSTSDITGILLIFYSGFALLAGALLFYFLNRITKFPPWLISGIFLFFMMILLAFTDNPKELANGRSLFVFSLPVIMASMLLQPVSSFVFALLTAIEIGLLARQANVPINITAIFGYFFVALISWLSSRSLEQALKEVRTINAELDQRVTDRTRELSQALAREAEQSGQRQAILQGIADGVVVFDVNGKAILANPALSRLTGLPLDEIISSQATSLLETAQITAEDRESLLSSFTHAEASLAPLRIHWGEKTLSVSAAPVLDTHNRQIGNVAVFRDFTREAEVEEMKNSFVAMVSHELRTPLNAILGYSEMLRDAYYGPVNEKQANVSDRILSNSRRLLDIVSDLLDKAQIEAGHLSLQVSTVPTPEILESLHGVMDKIAHDKDLELFSNLAPEMPANLEIDPKRIQQIMINLVNNAVKFTDEGSITVSVYKVAEAYWAFDVTDTGPGIAVEDQKYIFDPFRQVDKTITRSHGGIGLGLSIVKRLVDLMGGRIFLKSSLGHGSTFTVVLPLEPLQKRKKA